MIQRVTRLRTPTNPCSGLWAFRVAPRSKVIRVYGKTTRRALYSEIKLAFCDDEKLRCYPFPFRQHMALAKGWEIQDGRL